MRDLFLRIAMMLARGLLRTVDDSGGIQLVQVSLLADETRDGVERLQTFGHSSHPLPGARAFVAFVGGLRDHGIALVVDDPRYRPKNLQPGESILYDSRGQKVYLKEDGILVETDLNVTVKAGGTIRLEAPVIEIAAGQKLKLDVNGYGEDWVFEDGAWRVDNWKTGNVVPGANNAINPPEHP